VVESGLDWMVRGTLPSLAPDFVMTAGVVNGNAVGAATSAAWPCDGPLVGGASGAPYAVFLEFRNFCNCLDFNTINASTGGTAASTTLCFNNAASGSCLGNGYNCAPAQNKEVLFYRQVLRYRRGGI